MLAVEGDASKLRERSGDRARRQWELERRLRRWLDAKRVIAGTPMRDRLNFAHTQGARTRRELIDGASLSLDEVERADALGLLPRARDARGRYL